LLRGQVLKIWSAQVAADAALASSTPGTVVQAHADQLLVATGQGVLRILQVQLPGGTRISARDFLHSHPGLHGLVLGA
jgi:methionyl-tRNA formyltransferase